MKKNIPEIRFKGYQGEWVATTLRDVVIRVASKNEDNRVTLPLTISARHGLISQTEFFNSRIAAKNVRDYYVIRKGEFAYNRSTSDSSPFGAVKRLDRYDAGVLSTLYLVFRISSDNIHSNYLVSYFSTGNWHQHIAENAAEGARNHGLLNITAEDFFSTPIKAPIETAEQEKIGLFLKTLDKLIEKLEAKLDKLRKLKQALLNKMFINVNGGGKVPEIRFKGYNEGWTTTVLMELASKMAEKNASRVHKVVLTNSAEYGIIDQRHYFEREIVNGNNVQGYYVVQKNDYVYNPRISTSAPVGPINRNKLGLIGIVSPLYYVFRFNDHAPNFEYLDYFFKSSVWHKFMFTYGNSGARSDRFSISDALFITLPIQHPKAELEQIQIGTALSNLEQVIQKTDLKLTKIRAVKQSLLQKMFA